MTTTMKHPDNPNSIEVNTNRVALYAASGWVAIADGDTEPVKPAPQRRRRPAVKK
jgi:hypothetical protein